MDFLSVLSVVLLVWCGHGIQGEEYLTESPSEQPSKPIHLILDALSTDLHGIKSDRIENIDNQIIIPNFYYDGNSDALFVLGKGNIRNKVDHNDILPVSDKLLAFYGQTINITLPSGVKLQDYDWLAIWCELCEQTILGSIYFNFEKLKYPPQAFPLKGLVTSGPIVLVDKRTLFIPNFSYDGTHEDVHFWVGNGTDVDENGLLVPNEENSTENLRAYHGENIELNLPISTDYIDYFAVWSMTEKISLGHTLIKNISNVPDYNPNQAATNITIMRLPKCCPISHILTPKGCVYEIAATKYKPSLNIYRHNETHIDTETLDLRLYQFEPYVYSLTCSIGKYPLDEELEEVGLLQNGSLIVRRKREVKGPQGIFNQGQFCAETIDASNFSTYVLMCAPEETTMISKAFTNMYSALLMISAICFAGITILYCFIFGFQDIHKKCFLCYSSGMCVTFMCLIAVQLAHIENAGCNVVGFFFQFSTISSFTWFTIICYDIFYLVSCKIEYIENSEMKTDNTNKKRFRIYLIIAFLVPSILLIISLCRNFVPDVPDSFFKPQYGGNTCFFEEESQRKALFYIPILICIVASAVFLIWTTLKIRHGDKDHNSVYFWVDSVKEFKFVHRRYILAFFTMFAWFLNCFKVDGGFAVALEIIEAAQGILLLILFVVNASIKKRFMEKWSKIFQNETNVTDLLLQSLTNKTNGTFLNQ